MMAEREKDIRKRQTLLQEKEALRRRCQKYKDELNQQETSSSTVAEEKAELGKQVRSGRVRQSHGRLCRSTPTSFVPFSQLATARANLEKQQKYVIQLSTNLRGTH